ncbi:hypothetical protein ABKN59_007182 [Abortiporus biennis]
MRSESESSYCTIFTASCVRLDMWGIDVLRGVINMKMRVSSQLVGLGNLDDYETGGGKFILQYHLFPGFGSERTYILHGSLLVLRSWDRKSTFRLETSTVNVFVMQGRMPDWYGLPYYIDVRRQQNVGDEITVPSNVYSWKLFICQMVGTLCSYTCLSVPPAQSKPVHTLTIQ